MKHMTTGNKISNYRYQQNLSQDELAEQMNLPLDTITVWERGLRDPNREEQEKLAKIFNISYESLNPDTDDSEPIFKDNPQESPINREKCKKVGLIFLLIGTILALLTTIMGFYTAFVTIIPFYYAAFFLSKSAPLMPKYKKVLIGLFIIGIELILMESFSIFLYWLLA